MTRVTEKKIRILFIGEIISSHAQSWMDLLGDSKDDFEILSFGVPGSPYPSQSNHRVFLGKARATSAAFTNAFLPSAVVRALARRRDASCSKRGNAIYKKALLEFVIRTFRPHVIHTFAAFPSASFYYPVIKKFKNDLKWVLQVRGGPDVYMNSFDDARKQVLRELFAGCDLLIADNDLNYEIAKNLGIEESKCWGFGVVPGAGGVDIDSFSRAKKPSKSERRIIWPKAYEGYESKGLPVLEAIKIAWPLIRDKNVKFTFTAGNQELNDRLRFLSEDILKNIDVRNRIPRGEMLNLMMASRVVMAPSLLEGIPNTLYECMAARCVPIYSPLETYVNKFIGGKNVLYARNLYPDEIAEAIVTAMNNDGIADGIAENNLELVQKIANRKMISNRIVELYKSLK